MMRGRASALGVLFLLALSCGGGGSAPSGSAAARTGAPADTGPQATPGTTSSRTDVPDVVVRDVGTGEDVNLRALGLPERPTLYWFWAPH